MKKFNHKTLLAVVLPMLLLCVTSGCRNLGYWRCADIPYGAIPQPLGTFACQWQTAQAERAELDDFVVYQYEWLDRQATLSPFGSKHVAGLLPRLPESVQSVRIEPSGDFALDQQRQLALVNALAEAGIADSANRVELGYGNAEPLYGVEAPLVSRRFLFSGGSGAGRRGGSGFGGGNRFGGGSNVSVGVNTGF